MGEAITSKARKPLPQIHSLLFFTKETLAHCEAALKKVTFMLGIIRVGTKIIVQYYDSYCCDAVV